MARNLETDLETLRTVLGLAQKRDFAAAATLAERTLAEGFEHPMLLNIAATRLEQEGKYEEALKLLERAVAIAPTDVGARNALGLCLQRLDRPAEALYHIEELLKQHADLPFAHVSKGNALMALGSLGRAKQSQLRAFELEPGNFSATAALASIASHRGQHGEAREWADRTLKIAPGFPDAVLCLAAAELAAGDEPSAERRLRQLINDSRAGTLDRARATGMLADVFDSSGRYEEAFEAYSVCNQSLRQIHRRFTGANVAGYARALTAALGKADTAHWAPADAPSSAAAGHAFLLGFPRTGTTLVEVVLDGNPRVASLEEHELLADGVLAFMREPVDFTALARADTATLEALRATYWRRVRSAGVDVAGKVFVDKHPLNTLKLPLIAKLFPSAKILFALRDPRDVILSCFRRRFQINPSMYELLTVPGAAAFYAATMQFAYAAKQSLNLHWHEVRYERLIADFEPEMRAICRMLGLDWLASMGEFAQRVQDREHATPSTAQLSQGLITSATSQWRHYESQLAPALPALKPWIERLGY
ncbi:MAG TPA: sulfotransferase [Steroidobacteraceae bacterium]|jgi:tetratricopeptide (TPR) repeat protein|nr:sulfotransferase [Steroidobacteraceae bacterium]